MMDKRINIAIDGHSSCGKSTIAKRLASDLGYTYIDTGAMYRGVTLYTIRHNYWLQNHQPDTPAVVEALDDITLSFEKVGDSQHLFLNGEDVESEIRGMTVSNHVSPISTIPEVRTHLVAQQQQMAQLKGVVMDGRDVGTTVLPDAELKIFVTASPEVRAERRYNELTAKGDPVTYEEVLQNITDRDRIDTTRATSPLRRADDALLLDNSDLTLEQQQRWVMEQVRNALDSPR